MVQTSRQIIDNYGSEWGYETIPFYGQTTDVDYLQTIPEDVTVAAEWILRDDFDIHMGKKAGLIIGAGGKKLKELQNKINEKEGDNAVMAIWAKRIPDGRMVFTAYGQKDDAVLNALKDIGESIDKIMEDYGWTVYPVPMNVVFKRAVSTRESSAIVMPSDPKYLPMPSIVHLREIHPERKQARVWFARQLTSVELNREREEYACEEEVLQSCDWDYWITQRAA
jgi:hypothetical protein